MKYLAHLENGIEQLLIDHLEGTATIASNFAGVFNMAKEGYRCGLLHDIGKYSNEFQQRVRNANLKVDHSTAGMIEAFTQKDVAASFCIAGHHAGIPNRGNRVDNLGESSLLGRIKRKSGVDIPDYSMFRSELNSVPQFSGRYGNFCDNPASQFFFVHMLYSCLVDADWLDTENSMSGNSVNRDLGLDKNELLLRLNSYLGKWKYTDNPINKKRNEILSTLINKGKQLDRGLYTLTVPTGGGKTISSMAFALNQIVKRDMRRIIYVIPYTSIIDQTTKVFEEIFGAENVVAHYASLTYKVNESGNLSDVDQKRYLATENWDAPIIVTTSEQFFESLFSNRPSKCRKLHNIVDSVIIFDEAQMLPVNYIDPCIWSVTELYKKYRCSIVFCTATQPSLNPLISKYTNEKTIELCDHVEDDYQFFKRVEYRFEEKLSNEEIISKLSNEKSVLCVVNTRKEAQDLFKMLPEEGKFHLSTTMIPVDRKRVIYEIKERLRHKQICRVISTSLIEAGVDIDFDSVYREIAGIDSIIQAAGRCNREGKNKRSDSIVHVFESENKVPNSINQNVAATKYVLRQEKDMSSIKTILMYFDFLYNTLKDDSAKDEKKIMKLVDELAFSDVNDKFHLIETGTYNVIIPIYDGEELADKLKYNGLSKEENRKIGEYSVAVYERDFRRLNEFGAVLPVSEDTCILINKELYDSKIGLSLSIAGGSALYQ